MHKEILEQLSEITPEEQRILDGRQQVDPSLYNLNASRIVDAKRLLEKGALIKLRPHTRFLHFPAHSHNYVEMVYMCTGSTQHIINGSHVTLACGELLLLGQNAIHEIYPCSEKDIAVNFIVLPEFFDRSLDMIGAQSNLLKDFLVDCLKSKSGRIAYLHYRVAQILPVQNLIENLIWILLHKEKETHAPDQVTMGLLFMHLLSYTDRAETGKDHLEQSLAFSVLSYIDNHYRDGELSFLAHKMGYDLYWLSRAVKNATGRTYTQLLQEKRLRQARWLLQNTDLSVTDVSLSVGYRNFSYFYRIFQEKYGQTPRKLRTLH